MFRLLSPWIVLFAWIAPAEGADRRLAAPASPRYGAQYAVIVGVNYAHLAGSAAVEVPLLKTAESDAHAVCEILIAEYGYARENVRLLLGAQATRERIQECFGDEFAGNRERVKASDCLLFYFAGHGNRREKTSRNEDYVGLLYPADVRPRPGKGVDTISCVRIDDLLRWLQDYCAARHKLVILDSCHSGEVFNFRSHRSAGVHRGFRESLFRRPALQAIAAARASQVAADTDARGVHSPFTVALLEALQRGPDLAGRRLFGASELFALLPARVAEMDRVAQDPQGGWLQGEGDFYFIPVAAQAEGRPALADTAENGTVSPSSRGPAPPALMPPDRGWPAWTAVAAGVLLVALIGGYWYSRLPLRPSEVPRAIPGSAAIAPVGAPQTQLGTPIGREAAAIDRLVLRRQGTTQEAVCVLAERVELGRSLTCGFRFPRASQKVSNLHAALAYDPVSRTYVLEDLRSRNGTEVDGRRLTAPRALESGALVELGQSLRLQFDSPPSESPIARLTCLDKTGQALARYLLVPGGRADLGELLALASPVPVVPEALGEIERGATGLLWQRKDGGLLALGCEPATVSPTSGHWTVEVER